ncbi:MAG TPA: hypothetical protein VN042_03085 [Asticcacaulis sp.]|nr:hypothetical protein [Asticcacaulis sp.]
MMKPDHVPESPFGEDADREFETRLKGLFAEQPRYPDAETFSARIMLAMRFKQWFRQGFIVLAGLIGGIYALAQFIRVPLTGNGHAVSLKQAAADTDQTLRAGAAIVSYARQNAGGWLDSSAHYLGIMQTPMFFWISFALCLACLALYYAYSQEERI